ncbi:MAG: DsbC family protein [Pseudomonadota bacterium]
MKSLLFVALGALSLSACAQSPAPQAGENKAVSAPARPAAVQAKAGTPDARAVEAVRALSPQAVVEQVRAAPLPGFREVVVAGQVAYVSDDGRYLFLPGQGGALFDTGTQSNLTEASLAAQRKRLLETVPTSERIVFAPPNPKYRVAVFTDVSCGYCQKLHSEIAEYNRQGIAIEYLAFPRAGLGSADYQTMVSVWCSPDRRKALTDAKNGRPVPPRTCKTTVNQQYDVGQRAGLTGTPMILAEDGTQLGGYVPAPRLRQILDELAARRAPEAPQAAPAPAAG